VRELTGGEFCDRVIEATGKQAPLDLAAELTKVRGVLVVAGYHQDGPRQVNLQLWNWRPLYTHRYPLERLGDALDATHERPPGFIKALAIP
jgi:threonine dehydrogenase-like Zn-dependent dehydrogenase